MRNLISMATDSCHRVIMGKMWKFLKLYFCLDLVTIAGPCHGNDSTYSTPVMIVGLSRQ